MYLGFSKKKTEKRKRKKKETKNEMIASIDLTNSYSLITIYNKNTFQFIKYQDSEQIPFQLSFDIYGNINIQSNEVNQIFTFQDFINSIFNNKNNQNEYQIQYLGKSYSLNDKDLFYFYMNNLIDLLINESEHIEKVMIIIPDEINQNDERNEEIKKVIYSIMKSINKIEFDVINSSLSYLAFLIGFDQFPKEIKERNYIIIEINSKQLTICPAQFEISRTS